MEVLFLGQDNIKIKKIWETICKEAQVSVKKSKYMKGYFKKNILDHRTFGAALSHNIGEKICNANFELDAFVEILHTQITTFSNICDYAVDDLVAFYERDPACHWFYQPLLFYKVFVLNDL